MDSQRKARAESSASKAKPFIPPSRKRSSQLGHSDSRTTPDYSTGTAPIVDTSSRDELGGTNSGHIRRRKTTATLESDDEPSNIRADSPSQGPAVGF